MLIAVLSADTVINQLSGLLGISLYTRGGVSLFLVIGIITIICQLFTINFVSRKSIGIRRKIKHIRTMHIAVTVSQYFIILLFVYVMIDYSINTELLATIPGIGNYGKLYVKYLSNGDLYSNIFVMVSIKS